MTREEATQVLEKVFDSYDEFHENTDGEYGYEEMTAIGMAIEALSEDISEDGTLKVKVKDGSKVNRVLVLGDNNFGGLYYPE